MTPAFTAFLAAAWRTFRRERELLLRIALPLVFLPSFAVLLLTDPIPPLPATPRDEAAMQAWMAALTVWGQANALWYVLADVVGIYGVAAIAVLLLDPDRPTVGQALRIAGLRLPVFAAASLIAAVPVGLGMWAFVLPGLYMQARLVAATPLLAHRTTAGPLMALRESMRMTRGIGMAVTGAVVAMFLVQWLLAVPMLSADEWLRTPGHSNAAVLAAADAAIAATGAAFHIGVLLVGVLVYRARMSRGT
jgi:hypothetical protein